MHVVNSINNVITQQEADIIMNNLLDNINLDNENNNKIENKKD